MANTPRARTGSALIAAGAVAAAMALSACSTTVDGTAIASSNGTVPATRAAPTPDARADPPPPTRPPAGDGTGGEVDISVEIGECVNVGGTPDDATIANARCGSPEANYVVVSKESTSDGCVDDADQTYYETLRGVEQGALCLDVDWRIGDCFDMGGEHPRRTDCGSPMTDGVKVADIIENSITVNDCPASDTGFEYTVRKFVVCVDDTGRGS